MLIFPCKQIPMISNPKSEIQYKNNSSKRNMMFSIRCRTSTVGGFQSLTEAAAEHMRKRPSFYDLLRVKQNASSVEIKTAYRSLAKLYHPDAYASDSDSDSESDGRHFIEINTAYQTLSDPNSRAVYDLSLGPTTTTSTTTTRDRRSSSFGHYSVVRRTTTTRRWETDQCW